MAKEFEHLQIPAGQYLVCETERCKFPCDLEDELHRRAVSEWLPTSGYELREAPEIGVIHWYWEEGNEPLNNSRYCELWLPIVKKADGGESCITEHKLDFHGSLPHRQAHRSVRGSSIA